jgi:hypothetical protein
VASPIIPFTDPNGMPHRLVNHNKMLTRYAGAIGMKTGYTKRAGRGLIAAATRNGRTEIAIVLNVADTYGWAGQLLDAAFAQPIPTGVDRLPSIRPLLHIAAAPVASTSADVAKAAPAAATSLSHHRSVSLVVQLPVLLFGLLLTLWSALRARVVVRRRRRQRRRAEALARREATNRERELVRL